MGKVIIICEKICSGKSYYSKKLKESKWEEPRKDEYDVIYKVNN